MHTYRMDRRVYTLLLDGSVVLRGNPQSSVAGSVSCHGGLKVVATESPTAQATEAAAATPKGKASAKKASAKASAKSKA